MDTEDWEAVVGGWEGFEVERAERSVEGTPPTPVMRFYLRARPDFKVIKRMAYGFRDDAYFFLRIRAAFPGNS